MSEQMQLNAAALHSAPQALDPLTLPFGGSRLIEASAGTGKTYTISGLYLRLLLGDGIQRRSPASKFSWSPSPMRPPKS